MLATAGVGPFQTSLGAIVRVRLGDEQHPGITVGRTERTDSVAHLSRATVEAGAGQSGNPEGQTAEYGEVVGLARSLSVRAIERLGELMESEDERVAAVACSAVLDRAFGKPQARPLEKEDEQIDRIQRMTPEERLEDARRAIERARAIIARRQASSTDQAATYQARDEAEA
jgi:hypothetical protein